MRICLIAHGLPPYELAGVENHVDALARALGRAGHRVEVFAPRRLADLPDCSLRREVRPDYAVTWVQITHDPRSPAEALDPLGVAEAFGRFLDRERPEVVHVHHVVRVGLGLLDAVADAGLPLVFTAHDYFATGDRYTLLRPDMRLINGAQTVELQARCELAVARLNQHAEALGDYHVGVFPETVEPELAAELSTLLDGDPLQAGVSQEEWEDVLARRERLEQRRRAAFEQVDRWIAPTRFLRAKLVGAGYRQARIDHQPYGIELERFRGLPPIRSDASEPLRIGFVGSMTKHKGIHVLLDAVERLAPDVRSAVRVDLFGDSTDRVYVEHITARAAELDVHVRGAFLEPRLPSLMAELDVLVVPSLWYENFPFVIREAFAAGRLVVASDGGALPESVRDGVDGLLFERGSAEALAAALARLVQEPELRGRLLAGAQPVRAIEDQAEECCAIYAEAIEARAERERSAAGPVLPHLVSLSERLDELMHLPMRGLLEQTLQRIDGLEAELGAPRLPFHAALMGMVDHDLRTPERLRDFAAESGYLRREIRARDESRGTLEEKSEWLEGQLKAFTEERDWLRQEVEGLKLQARQALDAMAEEREWLKARSRPRRRSRRGCAASARSRTRGPASRAS